MTDIPIPRELVERAASALEESVDMVRNDYATNWRHGMPTRAAQLESLRRSVEAHESALADLRSALTQQAEGVDPGVKGYAMALNEVALELRARYSNDLLSTPLWAEFEKRRNKLARSIATPATPPLPPAQPKPTTHKQGCQALGGYGHGVGPCDCGASPPAQGGLTVAQLAQEIRRIDAWNSLGAGALAEALFPFIESAILAKQGGAHHG